MDGEPSVEVHIVVVDHRFGRHRELPKRKRVSVEPRTPNAVGGIDDKNPSVWPVLPDAHGDARLKVACADEQKVKGTAVGEQAFSATEKLSSQSGRGRQAAAPRQNVVAVCGSLLAGGRRVDCRVA